ncbi:MAG: pyridoxamine 5'-phosphate oxidase [Acidimicrobiales bacterium]
MAADLAALREDYRRGRLDEGAVDPDPIVQLRVWLGEAINALVPEPTAMVLATAGADGRPTTRTVLCKGIEERGLRFFTNRSSRKGGHLAANPACAVTFLWKELERQVGITGRASTLGDAESDAYFASRPRGSQVGAWASAQSEVVADGRGALEEAFAEVEARWPEGEVIPRPPWWGGYLVEVDELELWQGRPNRLHDRLRYRRVASAGDVSDWVVERLSP